MFCKHKWKVIDKTVLPSAFTQVATTDRQDLLKLICDWSECTGMYFVTTVVVIVSCKHCGKIKRYTERNP